MTPSHPMPNVPRGSMIGAKDLGHGCFCHSGMSDRGCRPTHPNASYVSRDPPTRSFTVSALIWSCAPAACGQLPTSLATVPAALAPHSIPQTPHCFSRLFLFVSEMRNSQDIYSRARANRDPAASASHEVGVRRLRPQRSRAQVGTSGTIRTRAQRLDQEPTTIPRPRNGGCNSERGVREIRDNTRGVSGRHVETYRATYTKCQTHIDRQQKVNFWREGGSRRTDPIFVASWIATGWLSIFLSADQRE